LICQSSIIKKVSPYYLLRHPLADEEKHSIANS